MMYETRNRGFTLLEILITLLLTSIIGSLVFNYFGIFESKSQVSLSGLQDSLELHSVMEKIAADHAAILAQDMPNQWRPSHYYRRGDVVIPVNDRRGHQYRCFSSGWSGTSEPFWETSEDVILADNSVLWQENGRQLDPLIERLMTLRTGALLNVSDGVVRDYKYYGRYGIVFDRYIKFEANGLLEQEKVVVPGDPEKMLRITIVNERGDRLTGLFASQY